jgi:hypothetical protein
MFYLCSQLQFKDLEANHIALEANHIALEANHIALEASLKKWHSDHKQDIPDSLHITVQELCA